MTGSTESFGVQDEHEVRIDLPLSPDPTDHVDLPIQSVDYSSHHDFLRKQEGDSSDSKGPGVISMGSNFMPSVQADKSPEIQVVEVDLPKDIEGKSDEEIRSLIEGYLDNDNFNFVYELLTKIKSKAVLNDLIRVAVDKLIIERHLDLAEHILSLTNDNDLFKDKSEQIKDAQAVINGSSPFYSNGEKGLDDFKSAQGAVIDESHVDSTTPAEDEKFINYDEAALNRIKAGTIELGDKKEIIEKKLQEYKKRFSEASLQQDAFLDSFYKIAVCESLLADGKIDAKTLATELLQKNGRLDDWYFNKAFVVIQDYIETGGAYLNGGTGINGDKEIPPIVSDARVEDGHIPTAIEVGMRNADLLLEEEKKNNASISESVVPPAPVVPPMPSTPGSPDNPDTPSSPESAESADTLLEKARSEYAEELIKWKNKTRESKNRFQKVIANFGVDKQLPESEEPEELKNAKLAYIEAKKNKNKSYIENIKDRNVVDGRSVETNKVALLDSIEKEFNELQKSLTESLPPLEKTMMSKALDAWRKMPRYQRILLSSTIATGVVAATGGMSLGGLAVYGGMRAVKGTARAFAGTTVAQTAGKIMDIRFGNKNEKNKNEAEDKYTNEINLENFAEKEKEMMRFYEKEQNEKKKQILKKGAVMMAAAGVTSLGMGVGESVVSHQFNGGTSWSDQGINKTGIKSGPRLPDSVGKSANLQDNMEKMMKDGVGDRTLNADNKLNAYVESKQSVESGMVHNPEAQVDFTSKGSIDAIHKLKADILGKYHESGKTIPPLIQEKIINKTPMEIAKELGFYDSNSNASALVLKGESLGIDENGDIYYQHLDGSKQIMLDSGSGEIDDFDGKMLTPKVADPLFKNSNVFPNEKIGDDVYPKVGFTDEALANTDSGIGVKADNFDFGADQHLGPTITDGGIDTTIINDEPIIPVNEDALVGNVTTNEAHIPLSNGKFVDVMTVNNERGVLYNGVSIAHEKAFGGGKMLVLDDQFQDGAKFSEARGAFAQAFEHTAKTDVLGPNPIAEPFEGGMIYGAHGIPTPDHISLLLNGKEIAKGQIVNGIPKIKINPDLKGGWLFADNVYERAFKHMDKVIKSGVKNGILNFSNH